jgi:pimeloyl-ACP methyl ester carboxylesterase
VPRIEISGIGIEYELLGEPGAHAVALVPGGRFSMQSEGFRALGEALAAGGKRVLLWDRPNAGASDMYFQGENESKTQAEVLCKLIRTLDLGPTAIGGGSAGSRCTLLAAAHDPAAISHLLQWWITGGPISLFMLGASYCGESAVAARAGGMEMVASLPTWKEQLSRNPRNRDYLLGLDPEQFIETMERWITAFIPSTTSPVPGMTTDDFSRITMPTLIFRGGDSDIWHPAALSEWVHRLIPQSKLVIPPWHDEAPMQRLTAAATTGSSVFLDWPLLAPQILEFTKG